MNKLLAVMLVVAVPALAQQQMSLVPEPEAPDLAAEVLKADCQAFPWKPVLIATGAAVTIATVIAVVLMVAIPGGGRQLTKADHTCGAAGTCDGWVNEPPQ